MPKEALGWWDVRGLGVRGASVSVVFPCFWTTLDLLTVSSAPCGICDRFSAVSSWGQAARAAKGGLGAASPGGQAQ